MQEGGVNRDDPSTPRFFTVEEARALLPILRPILLGMQEDKRQ